MPSFLSLCGFWKKRKGHDIEANVSQGLQLPTWITEAKIVKKQDSFLQFLGKYKEQNWFQIPHFMTRKGRFHEPIFLKGSCSSENVAASLVDSASLDESKILKNISEKIKPCLNGRCIYLVGMMGSGKTTLGKILSEALGFSFYDCDALIEQAFGGSTVAEIFKSYGEGFFRDNETEILQKLSSMHRLVVSTGGGAVVRPINWRHMQKGITVWLDVPLEALATRLTAIGTDSRPLLHNESGDPYSKTLKRLSTIFKERVEAYANADARVSLQNIASKLGIEDVCDVAPTTIAIEVLLQIENFLKIR
ncbi:Shikimate kinase [Handroanthus impetiginosus]|uniref:shikimate kinase n=1 Tax=Handroanthus impetiginosus TaxID=429701 RepID=A0A2G9HRR9_9LAMI|nr:Shikimate kinase [Handroanthus impetiginosus]